MGKAWKVWNCAGCLCGYQHDCRVVWGFFFHQSCYLKKWGNYMQNLFQRLSLRLWSQAWKIESEAPCFLLISQCITLCDLLHWKIVILNCYIEFLWGILPFWTVYNDHMRGFCFFFLISFFLIIVSKFFWTILQGDKKVVS